jgi:hypothetical protein
MDATFNEQELLLRAVWPADRRPDFWRNGRLSSAALKDKRGLSVNRTHNLPLSDAVLLMSQRFNGLIVSISVAACNSVDAYVKYCPSEGNIYHSEIHGSTTEVVLSDEQALVLARLARIELER